MQALLWGKRTGSGTYPTVGVRFVLQPGARAEPLSLPLGLLSPRQLCLCSMAWYGWHGLPSQAAATTDLLVLLAQGLGLLHSALCYVSTSPIKKHQTPLADLHFFFPSPLFPSALSGSRGRPACTSSRASGTAGSPGLQDSFCPKGFDAFPLGFSHRLCKLES